MKIDGEGVKMAFYGLAAIAVFAVGYSVYKKMGDLSKGVQGAADNTKAIAERIMLGIGEVGKDIGKNIDGAISSARQAVGLGNGYEMPKEYGATVLPRSEWPASTIAFIDLTNKKRGETGYSGWTVYSDGTIISPYKEYATDNNAALGTSDLNTTVIGRATNTGFLSTSVDSYDMFASNFNSLTGVSNVDKIPY